MNRKYVFMAEDNSNDVTLMMRALKKCQIPNSLVVVSDGREALDYLFSPELQELPSVAILDLKLPFIDGLEVLHRIRADERTRHLPVIIFSASIDESDRQMSLQLGADDFICKPINFDEFVNLMCRIVTKWL